MKYKTPVLSDIPLLIKAHVYTQVTKFSQVLTKSPLTPNFGGTRGFQSPPGTPRIGDHGGGDLGGIARLKRRQTGLVCTP